MGKYDAIIDHPHHVSAVHPRMSMLNRAAQFSPFAALTGYGDQIAEAARLTDRRIELTEAEEAEIGRKLGAIERGDEVELTWFVPDERKAGGAYVERSGIIRKVDSYGQSLIFTDGTDVPFQYLAKLEIVG